MTAPETKQTPLPSWPDAVLSQLTPDLYARFKTAIELGKWPNGERLTAAQRDLCLEAVLLYEHRCLPEAARTGYIPPKARECDTHQEPEGDEPLRWRD
jgi:uncharacterized protein